MPNHVTSRVYVTGDVAEVERFKTKCFVTHEDDQGPYTDFDFNTLIPEHPLLSQVVSGTVTDYGLAILKHQAGCSDELDTILNYPWVCEKGINTREKLVEHLIENFPEALENGRKALQAYSETQHYDWYHWRINNWGTKWGAYELEIVSESTLDDTTILEFTFQTAWSFPEPIFQEIAQEFPALRFDVKCFDEGWCFAGIGHVAAGEFLFKATRELAKDEMYEAVYGYPVEREEEEEAQ